MVVEVWEDGRWRGSVPSQLKGWHKTFGIIGGKKRSKGAEVATWEPPAFSGGGSRLADTRPCVTVTAEWNATARAGELDMSS